jgi:hypothetical protein
MKTILAIDPGANGGIAVQEGSAKPYAFAMPDTDGDLVSELKAITDRARQEQRECIAFIEQLSGFVQVAVPGHTMFKMGRNVGVALGALQAFGFRIEMITPQKWTKHFSVGTASACQSKTEWKNKLKAEAQRRFPDAKVTLKTSDALLMLEYGKHASAQLEAFR